MNPFMESVMKLVKAKRRRVNKKCTAIRNLTTGCRIGRTSEMKNKWAGHTVTA